MHLGRLRDSIQGEDRGRDVIYACLQAHQPQIVLDIGPHGEERSRHFIPIRKVMLGDYRRGLLVIHVHVHIVVFKLAQRLDAVV